MVWINRMVSDSFLQNYNILRIGSLLKIRNASVKHSLVLRCFIVFRRPVIVTNVRVRLQRKGSRFRSQIKPSVWRRRDVLRKGKWKFEVIQRRWGRLGEGWGEGKKQENKSSRNEATRRGELQPGLVCVFWFPLSLGNARKRHTVQNERARGPSRPQKTEGARRRTRNDFPVRCTVPRSKCETRGSEGRDMPRHFTN